MAQFFPTSPNQNYLVTKLEALYTQPNFSQSVVCLAVGQWSHWITGGERGGEWNGRKVGREGMKEGGGRGKKEG